MHAGCKRWPRRGTPPQAGSRHYRSVAQGDLFDRKHQAFELEPPERRQTTRRICRCPVLRPLLLAGRPGCRLAGHELGGSR